MSYSIMLTLPTELDMAGLSEFAIVDQRELATLLGESGTYDTLRVLLKRPFLGGIIIPRPPIVGEESGEDCSAKVEWCRLVQALEKSRPLDRRGSTEAAEAYEFVESSFGDNGTRLVILAVLVLLISLGGICKLRPRGGKFGLLGVTGLEATLMSSCEVFGGSTNSGEGGRADKDSCEDQGLGLEGDLGEGSVS